MRGIVIAGTHSGAGKTTITLALIAALRARGLRVASFKAGPDFIDTAHLTRAAGGVCHNLDIWMMGATACRDRLARSNADVAVVEGMMGLFDGLSGSSNEGSTAALAQALALPVVLVTDAAGGARSLAATVLGFQHFDPSLCVAGVIFNRVGGPGHMQYLQAAMAAVPEVAVLGGVPAEERWRIPERHLGLHMPIETADPRFEPGRLERCLDLDRMLALAAPIEHIPASATPPRTPDLRLGVAADEAFCFYYADNLERLEAAGIELVRFSPLHDARLPARVNGLYFGGGYPELHAARLAANEPLLEAVRAFATAGGFVYGECGGLMYLAQQLDGHRMAGLIPAEVTMAERLQAIGYREVSPIGLGLAPKVRARGHEFHHSQSSATASVQPAHIVHADQRQEGYCAGNVLASFIHLYFASCPRIVEAIKVRLARSRLA